MGRRRTPGRLSAFRTTLLAVLLSASWCELAAGAEPAPATPEQEAFFEKHVRPVLAEHCFSCHGPEKQKSGLRLDTRASMLRGGEGGAVLAPGNPDGSLLVRAIRYDAEPQMPPDGKLPAEAIEALTAWVRMGAPWPAAGETSDAPAGDPAPVELGRASWPARHWAFEPASAPAVPAVQRNEWPHTPVDAFILAKLEEKGLAPAAPASRPILIRRATYDLTGLPPTAAEIEAFVADPAPDAEAFAKVVDRLLASPRYGERWGRHWLDVARYGDTKEYVRLQEERRYLYAYSYRDWVIRAFNEDLPYDRFVVAQIAADLLPTSPDAANEARPLAALGFLTLGRGFTNNRHDVIDDRIDVVTRGFLGLSVGCARCHDHKYDPIPTEDYYSLYGVFASCEEPTIPPLVDPAAAAEERYRAFEAELDKRRRALERFEQAKYDALLDAFRARTADYLAEALKGRTLLLLALPTGPDDIRPMIVNRWVDYLEKTAGRPGPDPVFAPWHALAALGPAAFTTEAPAVIARFVSGASSSGVNPIVIRRLKERQPGSMADVARVYGELFEETHRAWRTLHPLPAAAPSLLANGSFEPEAVAAGAGAAVPREASFQGWTVTGARVVTLAGEGATDGTFAAVFADGTLESTPPTAHNARIAQTVAVEAGAEYDLSFDYAAYGSGAPEHVQSLKVEVFGGAGESAKIAEDKLTATGAVPPVFETRVLRFRANGPQLTVSFADATDNGEVARTDGVLDNVALRRVTTAPDESAEQPTLAASLADPAEEQLRQVLYAVDSPVAVTTNQVVGYYLYDAPVNERVVALRNQVGAWLANTAQAPPRAHVLTDLPVADEPRVFVRGNPARPGRVVPRQFLSALLARGARLEPFGPGSGRLDLARAIASADNPLTARVMVNRVWLHHLGAGLVRTPSDFGVRGDPPTHPELLDYLAGRFVEGGWSVKKLHRLIMLSAAYRQSSEASAEARRLDPENRLFSRMNRRRLDFESLRDSVLFASGRLDLTAGGPPVDLANADARRRTVYGLIDRQNLPGMFATFDFPMPDAHSPSRFITTVPQQALFLMNGPFVIAEAKALVARPEVQSVAEPAARVAALYRLVLGRAPTESETARASAYIAAGGQWEDFAQTLLLSNEVAFVD